MCLSWFQEITNLPHAPFLPGTTCEVYVCSSSMKQQSEICIQIGRNKVCILDVAFCLCTPARMDSYRTGSFNIGKQ